MVLSGGTGPEDWSRFPYRPEIVVDSVAELAVLLEKNRWRPLWSPPPNGSGKALSNRRPAGVEPILR